MWKKNTFLYIEDGGRDRENIQSVSIKQKVDLGYLLPFCTYFCGKCIKYAYCLKTRVYGATAVQLAMYIYIIRFPWCT